jgi:hypothetical protein
MTHYLGLDCKTITVPFASRMHSITVTLQKKLNKEGMSARIGMARTYR